MKRFVSPLIWLCAAGVAALAVTASLNPNGIYTEYINALDENTPPVAAVFTAAQDGVFPWSGFTMQAPADAAPLPTVSAPVASSSPQSAVSASASPPSLFRPLTETVTEEELYTSVSGSAPIDPAPSNEPSPEGAASEHAAQASEAEAEAEPEDPNGGFVTVDASWFDDALFIGDSHIEGFCDYADLHNATYYYKRGLDIWSVMKKSFVDGKITLPQALSKQQFGKIYLMLGINEIGYASDESWAAQYAAVVEQLRELQPDALIYIQSILHTSQKKSDSSIFKNETINARNEAVSHLANGKDIFYINCNTVFDDENGALTSTYTGDGVHMKAPYYTLWRDYLFHFGRADANDAK